MHSTMMDAQLTITQLLEHGRRVHGHREIVTWEGDHARRETFGEAYRRIRRLAAGLRHRGIGPGDVVGTFAWNHAEHVEAYFAVPCLGAVLHQLNIRLFPEQLGYVVADGGDRVIIVDDTLLGELEPVLSAVADVELFVVVGDGDASVLDGHPGEVVRYDDLLDEGDPDAPWPDLPETAAAAMCHTSGTTGDPKGVVYSHRSVWTHTLGAAAGGMRVEPGDRCLVVVPQFHANAWGLVHVCWIMGADLLLPQQHLQPEPLAAFVAAERPTCSAGVPTVWNSVLTHGEEHDLDLSSLQWVVVGGSAVPRAMIESFARRYGVTIVQAWGMTEMSPLGTAAWPDRGVTGEDARAMLATTGRIMAGVDLRIVADGAEQPWDGEAIGEIQVRGPWITGAYHGVEADEKFDDGWLRTGDMAVVGPGGIVQIVDRTKDVIKSGGEWISSVDLENAIMAHDAVVECAVVGVPDERWDERPLACVVLRAGAEIGPDELRTHLEGRVASWWIPERWTFVGEVPKTSVGKFSKKDLRTRYDDGELEVVGT